MREKLIKCINITSLVFVMFIIVYLIFSWNRIPEEIPVHFNFFGEIDSMGDKGTLILLVFVLFFIYAGISITGYVTKLSGNSSNASQEEKTTYYNLSFLLALLKVVLLADFGYIIFCTTQGRNLGILFIPIFTIGCVIPVVYYILKQKGNYVKNKQLEMKLKISEKSQLGEKYYSKIDWWIGVCLLLPEIMLIWFIYECIKGDMSILSTLPLVVIVVFLMLPTIFNMNYTIYEHHLKIVSVYCSLRIPYEAIKKVEESRDVWSSAAMSLDRIKIEYKMNGRHDVVYISPKKKIKFIDMLYKKINKKEL